MPPPLPSNLNKWFIAGMIAMVATALFASLRSKGRPGGFEIEKVTADAAVPTVDAASDARSE